MARKDYIVGSGNVFEDLGTHRDHHFDGFAFVHRTIAIGDAVDICGAVEHESWLDSAFQYVGQELVHVSTNRRRAPGDWPCRLTAIWFSTTTSSGSRYGRRARREALQVRH